MNGSPVRDIRPLWCAEQSRMLGRSKDAPRVKIFSWYQCWRTLRRVWFICLCHKPGAGRYQQREPVRARSASRFYQSHCCGRAWVRCRQLPVPVRFLLPPGGRS